MPLRYLSVYALVAVGTASLFTTGLATFTLPLIVFGLIPLAELFMPGTTENLSQEQATERLGNHSYDAFLFLAVPVLFGMLGVLLWRVNSGALTGLSLLGGVATAGVLIGAVGLNVGHEFGHRAGRLHQRTSKLLYLPALYMHFFIEHNFGHHMRVATEDDPATSQRGDWLYARWVRSIVGGLRSAWAIESKRVTRAGHSPLSLHNEVLRFFLIEAAALAAVAIVLSPLAAVAWMGAALIGVLTLETVNYVEHYGLRRELNAKGLPERVQPHPLLELEPQPWQGAPLQPHSSQRPSRQPTPAVPRASTLRQRPPASNRLPRDDAPLCIPSSIPRRDAPRTRPN